MSTILCGFGGRFTERLAAAGTTGARRVLPVLLLFLTLLVAPAQFTFATYNGGIVITGYTGPGGPVAIPSAINGLQVLEIGNYAFQWQTNVTSVVIPDSVNVIGVSAFSWCTNLVRVAIGDRVGRIAFSAFKNCTSLVTVTIGKSAYYFDAYAFANCPRLTAVYLKGNASPTADWSLFNNDTNVTIYYLPGTSGWGSSWAGHPAALWDPQMRADSIDRQTNRFQFTVSGTADIPIVVEACTNLAYATWLSLQTCTLTNGSISFCDSGWTNCLTRFYRIRSP